MVDQAAMTRADYELSFVILINRLQALVTLGSAVYFRRL